MKPFLLILLLFAQYYNCEIIIKHVEIRHLRVKDIGLIFDVTVYNDPSKKKETFNLRIRCDKCCLQAPQNITTCNVAELIGGNFGEIIPGDRKVVSLIWPTVTLYNRVGYCDIIILSSSISGTKIRVNHTIHFDTTINTKMVTEHVRGFLTDVNYVDCISPDLNPIRNCTPVDCEEKYFGRRNFFNTITKLCEEVPDCSISDSKDTIYDYTINECIDFKRYICQEHIKKLQHGRYDKNVWSPKHDIRAYANISHIPMNIHEHKIIRSASNDPDVDWTDAPWKGFLKGFFVISAALFVYFCISFCTFSLMMMLSKRSSRGQENESADE